MSKRYLLLKIFLIFIAVIYVVDFFGILKHMLELNFDTTFNYPMNGNVMQYAHQVRFKTEVDVPPINIYNYTLICNPSHKCIHEVTQSVPRLTILVKSAMEHFQRRAVIRKTWGDESIYPERVRTVFLLGTSTNKDLRQLIEKESVKFNDIVQADFIDSYYNNTIKTLIGFRWVVEYCSNSSYYMFVDDDYFVSIKNVFSNVEKYRQKFLYEKKHFNNQFKRHILYAGFVLRSSPHRHKSSKWYIPLREYPFDMWPPYVTAGAYVLSREAIMKMFYMSMYTKHFKFDDIYLGILALKANIIVTHCPEFYFKKPIYSGPRSYQHVIASHGYEDNQELLKTWAECHYAGYA